MKARVADQPTTQIAIFHVRVSNVCYVVPDGKSKRSRVVVEVDSRVIRRRGGVVNGVGVHTFTHSTKQTETTRRRRDEEDSFIAVRFSVQPEQNREKRGGKNGGDERRKER